MLCQTCREHVRQDARSDGRTKHVIQSIEAFIDEMGVDVKKEIIDVLHRQLEIFQTKFVVRVSASVEPVLRDLVTNYRHGMGALRLRSMLNLTAQQEFRGARPARRPGIERAHCLRALHGSSGCPWVRLAPCIASPPTRPLKER